MQSMMPYHHGSYGRPLEVFDPFSLYFWDDFPFNFPGFRAPPLMAPPRPMLPDMRGLLPRTKIDYKETPEAHHFKAELPGVKKEDVMVRVEDGRMLHISAKSKHEKEENKEKYHHVERGYGEFVSKFTLPPNAKPELMNSFVDNNGVLTITIPKHKHHHSHYNHQ